MTTSSEGSAPNPFELTHRFVERRYGNGELDWLWVKKFTVRESDVDCTDLTDDQLAARIEAARAV